MINATVPVTSGTPFCVCRDEPIDRRHNDKEDGQAPKIHASTFTADPPPAQVTCRDARTPIARPDQLVSPATRCLSSARRPVSSPASTGVSSNSSSSRPYSKIATSG